MTISFGDRVTLVGLVHWGLKWLILPVDLEGQAMSSVV